MIGASGPSISTTALSTPRPRKAANTCSAVDTSGPDASPSTPPDTKTPLRGEAYRYSLATQLTVFYQLLPRCSRIGALRQSTTGRRAAHGGRPSREEAPRYLPLGAGPIALWR